MKKILFMLIAVVCCLGLVGGAFAWFSDTANSNDNTFNTGTLSLVLSNDYVNWTEGVTGTWTSPDGWAPGDSFTATLYLKNEGSTGAHAVYENWDWSSVTGDGALANWIEVTEISDSIPWGTDPAYGTNYVVNFIPLLDLNSDGKLSLYELAAWGDWKMTSSTPRPWDIRVTASDDPTVGYALPAGGTLGLRFEFTLMEETGNDMQNKSLSIDLNVMASQNVLAGIP